MLNNLAKAIYTILDEENVRGHLQKSEISERIIEYLSDLTNQQYLDLREELITSK